MHIPIAHCSQCGTEIVGEAEGHVYFSPLCSECARFLVPLYGDLPRGHAFLGPWEVSNIKEKARKRAADWHRANPGNMPASKTRSWAARIYGVGE
ncbi:hypothetical protein LCGC14_0258420 [marine sediment metagenome]|uniref:Uncharacterized protein n=1 Tax=marine sediment metagenome TaxID=412755 RepID=A0A0F9UJ60_9ZZZZ